MRKKTKEEFIERARKIHGDKYDYSKVEYVDSQTKVCIICPEDGEFWQTPMWHLSGQGCPKCKNRNLTRDELIEKFREVHGDKYDYSKFEMVKMNDKSIMTCPEHGDFMQSATKHLSGQGCPECGKNKNRYKTSKEEFIKKAKEVHGDKYDYSKVEYVNNKTKVCIICPEHGEFWQSPSNHYKQNCPYCSGRKMDTEHFIKYSNIVHKNRYDYSKTIYVKDKQKVCITCPIHGDFYQDPNSHLNGCGCPECFGTKKYTKETFIERAKKIHGDKYDYSKVNYISYNEDVTIICHKHGEFLQKPSNHLDGCGCQKCALESRTRLRSDTIEKYIEKAKKIHGDMFDYSKSVYVNAKTKMLITCPIHGDFYQEAWSHLSGCGCPNCSNRISKAEDEIFDFLKSITDKEILRNVRNIIPPQEIDIYIPELKIGIEYNGLLWHSEKFKNENKYHYNKMMECKKLGINLIQIFEDEYMTNKKIVLSKIKHILHKNESQKIYARKTKIKEITYSESSDFLIKNHIQGKCSSSVYLGCFYNDNLIGVMSFKKINNKNWCLTRYASDINYICIGIAGKLLRYFLDNYEVDSIETFADRRWTFNEKDNLYTKLGFKFNKYIKPDYSYYIPKNGLHRIHKFNLRKKQMHEKYGFPMTMTEDKMRKKINAYKIWNCGLIKYCLNVKCMNDNIKSV